MKYTHAFAEPGAMSIIDAVNPETGLGWYSKETLDQVRARYPRAEVVDFDAFCLEIGARQDTPITWSATTAEEASEMLGCLPPAAYGPGGSFLVGEPMDHHAGNGRPRFTAYRTQGEAWEVSDRPLTRDEFKQACAAPVAV